jgi:uncharacterized protein involved in response to NO
MYFFERAFRSFFIGASIFASLSMLVWWLNYPVATAGFSGIPSMFWHAHEMVYGYALATVAGFLLTAVMNWTRMNSASGSSLALLFLLWLGARVGFIIDMPITVVAAFDMAFTVGLFLHFFYPIYKQKHWKQMGLASKFLLLIITNALFYLGAFDLVDNGMYLSVLAGLFLVLAINLTMMRRLIPFFTEKALRLAEQNNPKWIDISAVVGFFALMIAALVEPIHWATSAIAFPLVVVHLIRFYRWYHPGIWKVALLWPLHVSYGFMIFGMLLYAFVGMGMLGESVAIHALAAGGIGLLCSSIMARIGLGHTNRNVFEPPRALNIVFVILALTAVIRVILPMLFPENYELWMMLSQWGWLLGFAILSVLYWKILTLPSPVPDTGIRL